MKTHRAALLAAAAAIVALSSAGCGGRYGAIRWDAAAGRSCSDAQVLQGHRYYTAASDVMPSAILALRTDRPLHSRLWRETTMTPELFARLIDRMRGTRDDSPYGMVVLDDKGERVGVWCSYRQPLPVKVFDDGGVDVSPPLNATEGSPFQRRVGTE